MVEREVLEPDSGCSVGTDGLVCELWAKWGNFGANRFSRAEVVGDTGVVTHKCCVMTPPTFCAESGGMAFWVEGACGTERYSGFGFFGSFGVVLSRFEKGGKITLEEIANGGLSAPHVGLAAPLATIMSLSGSVRPGSARRGGSAAGRSVGGGSTFGEGLRLVGSDFVLLDGWSSDWVTVAEG